MLNAKKKKNMKNEWKNLCKRSCKHALKCSNKIPTHLSPSLIPVSAINYFILSRLSNFILPWNLKRIPNSIEIFPIKRMRATFLNFPSETSLIKLPICFQIAFLLICSKIIVPTKIERSLLKRVCRVQPPFSRSQTTQHGHLKPFFPFSGRSIHFPPQSLP